jgi:hypothetical protein
MQLSLLSVHICAVIKCGYHPLSACRVMTVLGLEVVILTSNKYKNALSIVNNEGITYKAN